jgi:hypothetical protein
MKQNWIISEKNGIKIARINMREIEVEVTNYKEIYFNGLVSDRYQYSIRIFGSLRECEGCPKEYKTIEQVCEYVEQQVTAFIKLEIEKWKHRLCIWEDDEWETL